MNASSEYRLRIATVADVDVIAHHRIAMFRDMRVLDERDADALHAASLVYLERALASGAYRGWVVERDEVVVAGGGVIPQPGVPRPENVHGDEEAYLLNMYVAPAHRRRGLGRRLMDEMLAWCRARGLARVVLHASDDGQALYASLGFERSTNEMRLVLRRRS
jgi:ribosomal protein S18 acetylase RimI-like enzyme